MKRKLLTLILIFAALDSAGEILPGFSLWLVGPTSGFVTSIAFDADDSLYYTTTDGAIWVLDENGLSEEVARVSSANEGNAALLGMAFEEGGTIVVHYVSSDLAADVVSRIELQTGEETVLARLPCFESGAKCPSEHHGGNPVVSSDGSIFVGIGDYGLMNLAQREDLNASKIFRITPAGDVEIWARGFRNPFDFGWDGDRERLIGADNGDGSKDDEIVFVGEGENHGWPLTMGDAPPVEGMTPPVYVFDETVAPTGVMLPVSSEGWFRRGVLVTSFVTRALYFFPRYDESTIEPPVTIFRGETVPLVDVRQNGAGDVYVATGFAIYRLLDPIPGDADGNGEVTAEDRIALLEELRDSTGGRTELAHEGSYCASWGADVNQDGFIDSSDLAELSRRMGERKRTTGHPVRSRDRPISRSRPD
ncbi:MAG: PQQ-dependent sugar dehydrogenase [Thermoanaerobaculia bacterium]|nr:PQQ-dependent sugar dehydrogenase [Thermoanaerobaculia bacterium]